MKKLTDCAICDEISGREEGDLVAKLVGNGRGYIRPVVLETERFAVIPSVGPLTLGHVLLCPKRHYSSFARLPVDYEEEYKSISDRLSMLLKEVFQQNVHVFEHGSDAQCSIIPCSVAHAHQHFVPANVDVWDALHESLRWTGVQPRIHHLRQLIGASEYLLYQGPGRDPIVSVPHGSPFESQYIRRVFAKALGRHDQWNWRAHPLPREIEVTFLMVSQAATA